jgi:hypothetical protein
MVAKAARLRAELVEAMANRDNNAISFYRDGLSAMRSEIHREYHFDWEKRLVEVRKAVGDHENPWKGSENRIDFLRPCLLNEAGQKTLPGFTIAASIVLGFCLPSDECSSTCKPPVWEHPNRRV